MHKQIFSLWHEHTVKASIIKLSLEEIESATYVHDSGENSSFQALEEENDKRERKDYKSLMKRPKQGIKNFYQVLLQETFEQRTENLSKSKKNRLDKNLEKQTQSKGKNEEE